MFASCYKSYISYSSCRYTRFDILENLFDLSNLMQNHHSLIDHIQYPGRVHAYN